MSSGRRTTRAALLLALVALLVSACAGQPFTEGPQVAIGVIEESLGDQYTLSAESLTVEWTFTEPARITLSFEGGAVAYNDVDLEPGCYSGEADANDVLAFDSAENVGFATPDESTDCAELPG